MAVKILIPTPLRPYAGNNPDVVVEGGTVDEALTRLTSQFPELRKHLYNEAGALRSFVNVYVNEEDIRYLEYGNTPLKDGQVISIVPSVAGGRAAVEVPVEEVQLSHEEIRRYSRHLIMPEVALEGQKKLKAARVLMIGTGGLGSPLGLYLAAAGVGHLGLVDFDVVDESNLQRQIIHSTQDVGRPKLESAKERILAINPHVQVETYNTRLTSANALELFADYDIIVDGTDNFPTRYLVNDACALLGKPNVYGSIFRFEGQASVFYAKEGPCYRCLYPEPPPPGLVPSCAEGGVLGILPGLIGVVQATETIKLILGQGEPLIGRLLLVDALGMQFRELKLRKNPECPACGENPTIKELIDYEQFCGIQPEPAEAAHDQWDITPRELKERLDRGEDIFILDVREPQEWEICRLPGATLIPLGQLPSRMHELNSADFIVAHCRSGARSANAVRFLYNAGFRKIKNLKGGTLAWSDQVDPTMPKY
jgi:adenylyltransferase/sulfurtransferase